jgi:hypothetical protein
VLRALVAAPAAILALALPAAAQDAAAQANNPLADTTAPNFQNLYSGELTGTDDDANQFFLRYAQPVSAFGGDWLIRATLPVNAVRRRHAADVGDTRIGPSVREAALIGSAPSAPLATRP